MPGGLRQAGGWGTPNRRGGGAGGVLGKLRRAIAHVLHTRGAPRAAAASHTRVACPGRRALHASTRVVCTPPARARCVPSHVCPAHPHTCAPHPLTRVPCTRALCAPLGVSSARPCSRAGHTLTPVLCTPGHVCSARPYTCAPHARAYVLRMPPHVCSAHTPHTHTHGTCAPCTLAHAFPMHF